MNFAFEVVAFYYPSGNNVNSDCSSFAKLIRSLVRNWMF